MKITFVAAAVGAVLVNAQDPCATTGPTGEQIDGPFVPGEYKDWFDGLHNLKTQCLASIQYNDSIYDYDEIKWTRTAFMQPQMHPYDLFFYTQEGGYNASRWLDDLNTRYGGIDAALVWPTYTNIGIDSRSQFQQITSMPGGIDAITKFSAELKAAGVNVLWPYNPWDTGTHRDDQNRTDAQILAWLCNVTNTDGFNGDTMGSVPEEFFQAGVDIGYPIAIEPEGGGIADSLNWDTMGWGYWNYASVAPAVSKWKWLEPRFLTNVCDRWNKNKTDNLQYAWFNAAGYETWENVWGTWNEIVPADGEAIRRVGTMLRFFGALGFTTTDQWYPHTTDVVQEGSVFASRFELSSTEALWTLVNRGGLNSTGAQLSISPNSTVGTNSGLELHYYDCYHGEELKPDIASDGTVTLSFDIEANGYGCVFATPQDGNAKRANIQCSAPAQPQTLFEFLTVMKKMTSRKLASYRKDWTFLLQEVVDPGNSTPHDEPVNSTVRCPGGLYRFDTTGVEIEGAADTGVDAQFPWEIRPSKTHSAFINVPTFDIDVFPVTVGDYAQYLADSGYLPKNAHNWLSDDSWHWPEGTGPIVGPYGHGPATAPPKPRNKSVAERPVVHVSLAEAREYCSFYGKRLPQIWEWQYAAQGGDPSNTYPWGTDLDPTKFPSDLNQDFDTPPRGKVTDYVDSGGGSPFGVQDLIGNIWQYTTEVRDIHTRAVLLKGSANYRPTGSDWYFPQALELNKHNKYFLMDDSYERAATVGFRCVTDGPEDTSTASPTCQPSDDSPLCARADYTPGYVDLTALGSTDWIHFGDDENFTDYVTRKGGIASLKGKLSGLSLSSNSNNLTQMTNVPAAFSWTNGHTSKTPSGISVESGANTSVGVWTQSSDGSLSFGHINATVEAGHTAEVQFFVGLQDMDAQFSASLSSGTSGHGDILATFAQNVSTAVGASDPNNVAFTLRFDGPATLVSTWGMVPPSFCTDILCYYNQATRACGSDDGDSIDLTFNHHDDWVKYETDVSGDGIVRKYGGGEKITTTVLDGSAPTPYVDDEVSFSWNDGESRDPSQQNDYNGIALQGQDLGFSISIPVADVGTTEAQVWVGVNQTTGTVTASLSDGSVSPVSHAVECQNGARNVGLTFDVHGAQPNATLNVQFSQYSSDGSITLQAAAVSYYDSRRRQLLRDGDGSFNFQAATLSVTEKQ